MLELNVIVARSTDKNKGSRFQVWLQENIIIYIHKQVSVI